MKKIISLLILVFCLLALASCDNEKNTYIEQCKEEFIFDYEEAIVAIDTKKVDGYLIVEIYGTKTFATYICNKGEVWNYENQSS